MTAEDLPPVVVRVARAKLNLTLAVVGRRPDGFHELHSVMAPLGLADRLSLAPAVGPADTVHVTGEPGGPLPDCGPADRNLVVRAIGAARAELRARGFDGPLPPLAARLEKHVPVAAGLGGGSSDGAAALDGALEAWGAATALGLADRLRLGAALGSDVPFAVAGGWAVVEGRGERVTPLAPPRGPAPAVLLITPSLAVSTAAVFAAQASAARPGGAAVASSRHLAAELTAGISADRFLERAGIMATANDLVAATAAVVPGQTRFRRALGRLLDRPVGQSGSGPTLWVLYPSLAAAETAAATIGDALADRRLEAPGPSSPRVQAASLLVEHDLADRSPREPSADGREATRDSASASPDQARDPVRPAAAEPTALPASSEGGRP